MAIALRYRTETRRFAPAVAVCIVAAAAPAVAQTDAAFTGGALDDSWTDPANWDTTDYPDNGDPAGATYDVLIGSSLEVDLDANITIEDLTLGTGTFGIDIDRETPLHTNTLTVNGLFTWTAGSLQGGNIDNVNFNSGVLNANGGINLNNAGPVSFSHWTINNAATTTITGSNLNFSANALFNNQSTGVVDFQTDADFVQFQSSASLTNAGTIRKSAGAGTSEIGINITQTSTGIIDVQTGTLDIGGGSYAGALKAIGGTVNLGFTSQPVSFDAAAFTVTNGGGVEIHNDADYNGTFTSTGDATGMVELTGDLNVNSGETAILNFSADAPISFWSTTGDGTLINQGAAIWAANTIGGGLTNQGDLEIGGTPAAHTLGADQTLTNQAGAAVTHVVDTAVNLDNNSAIDNHGLWDIQIDHNLLFDARTGAGQTFTNTGTLRKTAGAGTALIKDVALTSTGTILSTSGTLEIQSAGRITGQVNADGGAVELAGGDLVLDNVAFDVRNGGQVTIFQFLGTGDTTQLEGTFTSTGDGTGQVAFGGPLHVAAGENVTFNLVSDASTFGAPAVLNGELDGPGDAQNTGTMIHRTGARILMGDGTAAGGGFVNAAGGSYLIEGGSLGKSGNAGTLINQGGSVMMTGTLFVDGASRMVNTSTGPNQGVWTLHDSADILFGSAVFDNQATFHKTGPGDSTINPTFNNTGSVLLQGGTLFVADFNQSAGQLVLDGGNFHTNGGELDITGGTVTGNGTIDGTIQHDGGTFAPGHSAGVINISSGFYRQGEGGILLIEIGGTTAGSEYDVLAVREPTFFNYSAFLAGVIEIDLINGFNPVLGDTFDIMLSRAIFDEGYSVNVLDTLSAGLSFQDSIVNVIGDPFNTSDDHQIFRLTVVPEPATAMLLALGGVAMLGRTRRRDATIH